MGDLEFLPQWVKDFQRLDELENTRQTKLLLEESVKLQQDTANEALRAAREEKHRHLRKEREERDEGFRIASLPKCPECQTPLEGNRPRRCAACRSDIFWILNTPLGVRQVTQTLAKTAEDPLIIKELSDLEVRLVEYRNKRRELFGFPWLPNPHLCPDALLERAQQVASATLGKYVLQQRARSETLDGINRQLLPLTPRLKQKERALKGLFFVWRVLCVLFMFFFVCISMLVGNLAPLLVALGFGLCSSPVFLIGWGIINMREYALRAEINPLQAKLEHLSKPEDVRLAVDVQVLDLKLNEANGAHRLFPSTSCLRAEDVSGLNQIERVGLESWVEWREDLGEDLRQVFDSITCIVAVTRLKQASERASGLLQNVNDISRDLGHQSPPEIPKLNELVAGFHKMQDSGPIEEQVHAGGDNQGDALPAGPFAVPPGSITNSIGMQLVPIPVGEFLMGSAEDCPLGDPDEEFQHRVRISKPFLLGMHQVTQRQYERVTGENPSHFKGNELPVEHLSWKEALRFCEMLSSLPAERQACRRYRLPTEAEWEFACRAGTTTPFNTGHTLKPDQARFSSTSRSSPRQTATVGSYQPNAWGIFDMHGNVWEWTADWFSADYFRESPVDDPQGPATGTHHTLRGGSASVKVQECCTTIRGESPTDGPDVNGQRFPLYGDFGVRVVCEASTVAADEPDGAIHHRVGPTLFDLKTEIVAPNHPCKDTDLQRLDSVSGVDDLRDVPADDCSAAILISDALTLLAAADKQVGSAEIQAIAHIISTFRVVVSGEDNINRIKQAVAEIKARGVAVFANTVRDRLTPHRGTQFLDDLLKAMVDLSKRDGAAHENEMRVINWFNQQLGDKAL